MMTCLTFVSSTGCAARSEAQQRAKAAILNEWISMLW
jgi:hypothetical protein